MATLVFRQRKTITLRVRGAIGLFQLAFFKLAIYIGIRRIGCRMVTVSLGLTEKNAVQFQHAESPLPFLPQKVESFRHSTC